MNTSKRRMIIALSAILSIILSIYIVQVINNGSPGKLSSNILVGGFYFIVDTILFSRILTRSWSRGLGSKKKILIILIISVGVANVIINAIPSIVPNKEKTICLSIESVKNMDENMETSEVWITQVLVDDEIVPLESIQETSGWTYKDGCLVTVEIDKPLEIILEAKENINIKFVEHLWSGTVRIDDGNEVIYQSLYNKQGSDFNYEYVIKKELNLTDSSYIVCMIATAIITFMAFMLCQAKKCNWRYVYICLGIVVFTSNLMEASIGYIRVIMILFTVLISYILRPKKDKYSLSTYLQGTLNKVVFGLITLYTLFACTFNTLFVETGRFILKSQNICVAILFLLWLIPAELAIITLLDRINVTRRQDGKESDFKVWIKFFILFMSIWMIFFISFYPANMSSDSIDQWKLAIGIFPLNDWHPIGHTLIISLLLKIVESPVILSLAQMTFTSCIFASCFRYFYKKGIGIRVLYIMAIILAILPNTGVNVVTIWKDIPYTVTLVWLTYLLLRFVNDKEECLKSIIWLGQLGAALVLVTLLRHNGIVVLIACTILFCIVSIRERKKTPIIVVMIAILTVIGIKGPICKKLEVNPNAPGIKYISPIHDIAGEWYYYDDITEETQEFMEGILEEKVWKELYNQYSANPYMFENEYDFVKKLGEQEFSEVIGTYIKSLINNPGAIIYYRLSSFNLLWDVTQPNNSYNNRYCSEIIENDIGLKQNQTKLTELCNKYLEISAINPVTDTLIWRVGIYLVGIIIMSYRWVVKRNWKKFIVIIPLVSNIVSLALTMNWQEYRYIYFIFLIFYVILLDSLSKEVEL